MKTKITFKKPKRSTLLLGLTILWIFAICIFAPCFVEASSDESPYALTDTYVNDLGQRVKEVIAKKTGESALEVLAKGNNLYVATYNTLLTSNCKGPEYFDIRYNTENGYLYIYWVDTASNLWKTSVNASGVQQTQYCRPYVGNLPLNTVTASNPLGSTGNNSYNYNSGFNSYSYSSGYNAGYTQGYRDGKESDYYNGTAYNSDASYANGYATGYAAGYSEGQKNRDQETNTSDTDLKVTKTGNYYKVSVDGDTYEYKFSKNTLTYNGTEICDEADEIAFTDEYVLYFVGTEVYVVELGRKYTGELILDDFDKIYYESSKILNYIKVGSDKYYAEDIEDLLDDDDDDDDYPYVRKSSEKYTYYKSSTKKYSYEYDGDIVIYNDDEIVDEDGDIIVDIKTIAFSEGGYLYLLADDGVLYQVKVGKDEAEEVDTDIDRIKASSYFVTYVYDEDGDRLKVRDYE